jgi:hypothetical protein
MAMRKQNKCGKRTFHSLEAATRPVLQANAQGTEEQKRPLRTYYCHRCGGYHLTSKEYGYPG